MKNMNKIQLSAYIIGVALAIAGMIVYVNYEENEPLTLTKCQFTCNQVGLKVVRVYGDEKAGMGCECGLK